MKKHFTIIALALFTIAATFCGCKKDNDNNGQQGGGDDTPVESTTYVVKYVISDKATLYTMSPCFKANFTYINEKGETVEESNITLPWETEIIVKAPFTAQIAGTLTYKEEELPETVYFGCCPSIMYKLTTAETFSTTGFGVIAKTTKQKFIENIKPKDLRFSEAVVIE